MKKQLPRVRKRRQKTVQQSMKRHHWSNGKVDAGTIKTAPEQYPTTKK
jgi:hypothetical protein